MLESANKFLRNLKFDLCLIDGHGKYKGKIRGRKARDPEKYSTLHCMQLIT